MRERPATAPQAFVTGLDGIRRSVDLSPVRQVVENVNMTTTAVAPIASESDAKGYGRAAAAGRLEQVLGRPHPRAIAFGLVAGGLLVGGTLLAHNVGATASQAQTSSAATQSQGSAASTAAAVAAAKQSKLAELNQVLAGFTAAHPGLYSLYVKDLSSGATSTVNADASMTSASLYKLFVAQQVYRQVDSGQLVYGRDAGGGSGRSVDACLRLMINISDNTCGRALGQILGWDKQDAGLKADGYAGTTLVTPQQTTASDVGRLLEKLYLGTLASTDSNQRFNDLLKSQTINDRLPTGLPAGTAIAHKTGDLDGYMHDAGIVYGPTSNYVVVMMGAPGARAADFTELSAKLWGTLER